MAAKKVLILGTNERSALACIRSLGAQGIDCDIAQISGSSIAEYSRYARSVFRPDFFDHRISSLQPFVTDLCKRQCYDLLIPIDDLACEIVANSYDLLTPLTKVALPPLCAYEYAHDKAKTMALAKRLEIPAPKSQLITDLNQAHRLIEQGLTFPCYLKPIYSAQLIDGVLAKYSVLKARNTEQFLDFCLLHLNSLPLLVQEECPGDGVGVYLIASQGKILAMLEQVRLHQPLDGGGSSLRQARPLTPILEKYTRLLMQELNWDGVAMCEYKYDPDTQSVSLMEINPRFWGSLALSIRSGFDFPFWAYQLHLSPQSINIKPPVSPAPVRQRHLRKDLGWWISQLKRAPTLQNVSRFTKEMCAIVCGRESLDNESFRDPLPSVCEWFPLARIKNLSVRLLNSIRYKSNQGHYLDRARATLSNRHTNILVLCRGNIQRSAFAHHYLAQKLGFSSVRSAGFAPLVRRQVPTMVRKLAQDEFGVDLEPHRSSVMSREMVEWADLVLLMDYANLTALKQLKLDIKPYLLVGSLNRCGEICDPWAKGKARCRAAFGSIVNALTTIEANTK